MLITEAREENIRLIRRRYPSGVDVRKLDMDAPNGLDGKTFDVVFSYGLLYHLEKPDVAIAFLAGKAKELMLLETCVSFGSDVALNRVEEPSDNPTQAISGTGCRPTRPWVVGQLKEHFEHVYVTATQPWHAQFPIDWTAPEAHKAPLQRAVFVAARAPLVNDRLSVELPMHQTRHA